MIQDHAIVDYRGYRVPLILLPPSAMEQECECCHIIFPLQQVEMSEAGQMLCKSADQFPPRIRQAAPNASTLGVCRTAESRTSDARRELNRKRNYEEIIHHRNSSVHYRNVRLRAHAHKINHIRLANRNE
jgi:hypothetical protein